MTELDQTIPCEVEIRRNSDGLTRINRTLDYSGSYMWEMGNFSCDCNRYLFFQRAVGEPEDGDECDCSDGKYSVRIKDLSGEELYRDGTW